MAKKKHAEHVNHERWLVSYADFITLLFAFFVVMFAVSKTDSNKVGRFSESFQEALGFQPGIGKGVLDGDTKVNLPAPKAVIPAKGKLDEIARLERAITDGARGKRELAGLKVVRRGNELVLRLDAAVLFGSGDDHVSDDAEPTLEAVAALVRGKSVRMRVEGHTDDRPINSGRYRSNWDLSSARATSVVVSLAERHGFDPGRLAATGYAEHQPVADNATESGRAQNRRVDFVVTLDHDASGATIQTGPAAEAAAEPATVPAAERDEPSEPTEPAAAHED